MTDYETCAASLFDGDWRADDRNELIREYGLTEEEADKICELADKICELLATLYNNIVLRRT